jgi:uncharacterized protein YdeI (YjbR/CyaY-like superfamily)
MKPTFFRTPAEFRRWLEKNHGTESELLLGFYRRDAGKGGITYSEALDEALCCGWIDGVRKRLDGVSYTVRFTPRKPDSVWSAVNTKRIGELMRMGRVHASGQNVFDNRNQQRAKQYSYEREESKFDDASEKQFRADKTAWKFYEAQAPWYRRTSCYWVMSAKREGTRLRRLTKLIGDSAAGRRIDMLNPLGKK